MITPMSVNNSIFKGDDFKLKFQMLHLGMDVLFVIWSTTIGKIVSGHSHDCRFFFLVIFSFLPFGRAQRGVCTAEDGRKAERSSAPYAEAYSPRFARTCLGQMWTTWIERKKNPFFAQ